MRLCASSLHRLRDGGLTPCRLTSTTWTLFLSCLPLTLPSLSPIISAPLAPVSCRHRSAPSNWPELFFPTAERVFSLVISLPVPPPWPASDSYFRKIVIGYLSDIRYPRGKQEVGSGHALAANWGRTGRCTSLFLGTFKSVKRSIRPCFFHLHHHPTTTPLLPHPTLRSLVLPGRVRELGSFQL